MAELFRSLPLTLQGEEGRAAQKCGTNVSCQRLLTLFQIRKVRADGGVLHGGQRRVDLERLDDGLDALGSELVVSDTASRVRATYQQVSAAADTLGIGEGPRT